MFGRHSISKLFESDALRTSVDDDNEHACIFEKTIYHDVA